MPASIGVNLRVTGHCSQGGRKYMEDLFSVAYQQTEDERDLEYAFFGIYDGHGGSEAAAFAKEHLMDSIVKQRQFWSDNDEDVLKAIRNGYMLTHLNMWKELEQWPKTVTGLPSTAGTTASIAFIRRGKIYIGHVGDSAIVLGYQKDGSEEWAAKPLTSDHKPESTAEMERIQRCGGKVISKAGVPRVVWNRPRPGHKGPIKKNTPMDEIPFLAVARSLGDLWSYNNQNDEFIVSPDPDVGVLTIDPTKFRCLIFGTDGLWNMISPEGAVSLVQATERHNEAALVGGNGNQPRDWLNPSKSLVDHALERWSNTRMRADNTSVVTLMLDPPGPPRATVLRSKSGTQKPQTTVPLAPPPVPTAAPPKHDDKVETSEAEGRQMPQNGLTIMTRYSDVDKPSGDIPDRNPLPPCATLDGRFSIGTPDDGHREQNEADDEELMTNYGNPAESYFMARLLNRHRLVNTLSDVYEEIVHGRTCPLSPREPSPPATVLPDVVENNRALDSPPTAVGGDDLPTAEDASADNDVRIQINEVSSSSPTEVVGRPRGRRPKAEVRVAPTPSHDRVLRSHDSESHRPVTRQSAPRPRHAAAPPPPPPPPDRVVILSRRAPHAAAPTLVRVERPPPAAPVDARPTPPRKLPPEPASIDPDEPRRVVGRATRSQQTMTPTSVSVTPLAQKITRSIGSVARELRGAGSLGARAGNCARAPGPARRAPAARREARSKENLGGARGARGRDQVGVVRRADSVEHEVHSTTGEPTCGRARALRSRNDTEPVAGGKRARPDACPPPAPHKAAKLSERCARSLNKRASGPWAPALALRNRLRKRLAK